MELGRRSVIAGAAAATIPLRQAAADGTTPPRYRTATDLVASLANHEITARQLTDACIARIEAMDGKTNAIVVRVATNSTQPRPKRPRLRPPTPSRGPE